MSSHKIARDPRVSCKRSSVIHDLLYALSEDDSAMFPHPLPPSSPLPSQSMTPRCSTSIRGDPSAATPTVSECLFSGLNDSASSVSQHSPGHAPPSKLDSKNITKAFQSLQRLGRRGHDHVSPSASRFTFSSRSSSSKHTLSASTVSSPLSRPTCVGSDDDVSCAAPITIASARSIAATSDLATPPQRASSKTSSSGPDIVIPCELSPSERSWATTYSSERESSAHSSERRLETSYDWSDPVVSVGRVPDRPRPLQVSSPSQHGPRLQQRGRGDTLGSCDLDLNDIGLDIDIDSDSAIERPLRSLNIPGEVWSRVIAKVFPRDPYAVSESRHRPTLVNNPQRPNPVLHAASTPSRLAATTLLDMLEPVGSPLMSFPRPPTARTTPSSGKLGSSWPARPLRRLRTKSLVGVQKSYIGVYAQVSPTEMTQSPSFLFPRSPPLPAVAGREPGNGAATTSRTETFSSDAPVTPSTVPEVPRSDRWQDSAYLTGPCSGKSRVTYKDSPIIFDQETGELGFARQEMDGRVGAVLATHPAFEDMMRRSQNAGKHLERPEIDDILKIWLEAGRDIRVRACKGPSTKDSVLHSEALSTFSNDSSTEEVQDKPSRRRRKNKTKSPVFFRGPWSTFSSQFSPQPEASAPTSQQESYTRQLSSPQRLASLATTESVPTIEPRPCAQTSNTSIWTHSLISEPMTAFRRKHSLPPLVPNPAIPTSTPASLRSSNQSSPPVSSSPWAATSTATARTASDRAHDTKSSKHPHHDFQWQSTRLACRLPHQGRCSICLTSCCRLQRLTNIIKDATWDLYPGGRPAVMAAMDEMTTATGPGVEGFLTFVACSECKRVVCPGCCRQCPGDLCGDVVCKHCSARGGVGSGLYADGRTSHGRTENEDDGHGAGFGGRVEILGCGGHYGHDV